MTGVVGTAMSCRAMMPASQARRPASMAELERACHRNRIVCLGDGRVQQHRIEAQFHRLHRVARGADAGVHHQRHVRQARAQCAQRAGVEQALARTDRGAPRHEDAAAGIQQALAGDQVVRAIGKYFEACLHQFRAACNSSKGSGCRVYSSPTTSSLIQCVPNSSRAIFASVTASRAVRHPAVLGSRRAPLCWIRR